MLTLWYVLCKTRTSKDPGYSDVRYFRKIQQINSFYIVLIIFISIMFHLQWNTCELAGEVFFFN